jgi:ribosomal protein S18 acetylase RimI-like enzyme
LEEETKIWAQSLAWDYRNSAEMICRYMDAKVLPGYVAVQNGRALGYCFFVYEGNKGVVGDLYVSRALEGGHETEFRLLTHGIATLQQSPGIQRVEAQLLLHETGVVAEPFLQAGFRQHQRLFMMLPLGNGTANRRSRVPAPGDRGLSLPSDIEVRHWSDGDYHAAATVITSSYYGHIDADINDQYHSTGGSLRFLNNIVRFPGCGTFDNGASFVAMHRPTRTMVALVLCSRVKDEVGHVTQVCVVPGHRGRRLGEILLDMTSGELRRRGFSSLTLTVTEANRSAVNLYLRLGYRIHRRFDAFVWER